MSKIAIVIIIWIFAIGGVIYCIHQYSGLDSIPTWPIVKLQPKEEVKAEVTIEAQEGVLETKNGDNFSIVLEANPTTGYQWEIDFDSSYIQLVGREYTVSSPELLGSGGKETFNFLSVKSGETGITFSYLRPWEEGQPPITKIYKIIITD